MQNNQEIAQTILAQLGGNKFRVMTGASSFSSGDASLGFRLPRTPKGKYMGARIKLDVTDTYTVTFLKTAGSFARGNYRVVEKAIAGVYADQLRAIFTSETGLAVSL